MIASDSHELVHIHADESCLGNQFTDKARPGGAAGLIEVFDRKRGWTRRDYYISHPDTTNNRMAIRSAIEGLQTLKKSCRVAFYSDSKYLVQGMKEWLLKWEARGWKRKGGPIQNLELWQALKKVADRHKIDWKWVRGHAGDAKNEYVNQLAGHAAESQKNSNGLVDSGFDAWLEAQQEKGRLLDFFDLPSDQS